jgi:hypothetical protein
MDGFWMGELGLEFMSFLLFRNDRRNTPNITTAAVSLL